MFCTLCGKKIGDTNARFCNHCGAPAGVQGEAKAVVAPPIIAPDPGTIVTTNASLPRKRSGSRTVIAGFLAIACLSPLGWFALSSMQDSDKAGEVMSPAKPPSVNQANITNPRLASEPAPSGSRGDNELKRLEMEVRELEKEKHRMELEIDTKKKEFDEAIGELRQAADSLKGLIGATLPRSWTRFSRLTQAAVLTVRSAGAVWMEAPQSDAKLMRNSACFASLGWIALNAMQVTCQVGILTSPCTSITNKSAAGVRTREQSSAE